MTKKKKAAIWVVVLAVIACLILWHVIYWHSIGMYMKMSDWVGTDKTYVVVLYNLGLMLGTGSVLGFFMGKVTDLIGYEGQWIKHFKKEKTDDRK